MGGETKVHLPRGKDGGYIQAISLDTAETVTIGLTSSNYSLSGFDLVRVALSEDSWVRFVEGSGGTVSPSNGHYFPKGVEVLVVPRLIEPYMAVIAADGTTGFGSLTKVI